MFGNRPLLGDTDGSFKLKSMIHELCRLVLLFKSLDMIKKTATELLILILISLFCGFPSNAQESASIDGFIKDLSSGETLIHANIYLAETLQGATSNRSGYFRITGIRSGRYTLVASYIGYDKYQQTITISSGQHLRRDIEIRPSIIETEGVIIEAEMAIDEAKPVGVVDMQLRMVKQLPAILEADLFRSIQLLPGIKAASDFSSGLYIRGGNPGQNLILIDRTTVYNPSHFFGFFSTFNPDAIKDVRIFKGGYPAEYGGRLGSVIDIYNRDGNRKEFQGRLSIGTIASRLMLEGPIKRGSWMLAARRSTLEPMLAILRNNVDDVPDAFYFYDLNGKINYDPGPNDKLNISLYSGFDKVKFPFADDADFDLRYGNLTLSTNWTHIFSQKIFSVFTLTGSRYFNYPRINISGTKIERDNKILDISAKGDFEFIGLNHQMKAGFWAGDLDLTFRNRFDEEETLSEKINAKYGSVYFEETWKPNKKWNIKGGIRGNFFSAGDYIRFEPRLSVEHIFSQRFLTQVALGRYYQFLTLITNEAFSGFDTWLTTDEGVPPSWGDQFILGFKTRPKQGLHFDLEIYYRTMRDLFEFDPRVPDPAGLDYKDLFRFGKGYAFGAEFFLEKKEGRLFGFIGYTWATSRRRFPGYNNDKYYPPKYDRVHDINIVMNYKLSEKWRLTSVFNYATGQTFTPVLGTYYVKYPTNSSDRAPFIVGDLNSSRLPSYHRFDLGFIRFGKFLGFADYQLQIQIVNLYSRRNLWFYAYDLDENPIKRDDVRMLPIIPSLSFSLEF